MPNATYHSLREQIQSLLSEGKVQVKQAGEAQKTETYWHIGDALLAHVQGQPRADYGELSWSHYRRLIHLPTQAAFRFYLDLACDDSLSVRQLDEAIGADLFTTATTAPLAVPLDQDPFDGRPLRFRLAGIDTPELSTLAGRNARDFTTEALTDLPFVIVRTFRTDDYGRYLVDVRYLPGETDPDVVRRKGIFLNRQLLEQRLARRYMK